MNESELEQKLRALRPSRPSHELEVNIGRELAPSPAPRAGTLATDQKSWLERLLPALGWGGLGAACSVVVMLSLNLAKDAPAQKVVAVPGAATPEAPSAVAPSVSSEFEGNSVSGDVVDASYEGVIDGGQDGLARRIRYSSIERRSWKETDGAVTVVEIPREDIVVLPVSVQ